MNNELTKAKKILTNHNYFIGVYGLSNGCVAKFPDHVEYPETDAFDITYTILPESSKLLISWETGTSLEKEHVTIPIYAMFTYISFHIAKQAMIMKYNTSLIMFYVDNIEVKEHQFHEKMGEFITSEKDEDNQTKLIALITQAFKAGFAPPFEQEARRLKIYTSYKMIADLFQNEEIVDDT